MNRDHLSDDELLELSNEIPAGRFASPAEVADAVWQLAGNPAYLTGQVIVFDGGLL